MLRVEESLGSRIPHLHLRLYLRKGESMIWSIAFIILVTIDGFLTQKLLALGGTELNPLAIWSIENLWARILFAIAVVAVIRYFKDEKLIVILTFAFLGICIWNGMNLAVAHAALYAAGLIGVP